MEKSYYLCPDETRHRIGDQRLGHGPKGQQVVPGFAKGWIRGAFGRAEAAQKSTDGRTALRHETDETTVRERTVVLC